MSIFAELRAGCTTRSPEDTQSLAEALAMALPHDSILALHGDLGVGKTTFVRGLGAGFGIQNHITSPTFSLFNIHHGRDGFTLVHMDAYRLEGAQQMEALMLEDFLRTPYCLVVEWPGRVREWLPARTLHVTLSILCPGEHHLRLA